MQVGIEYRNNLTLIMCLNKFTNNLVYVSLVTSKVISILYHVLFYLSFSIKETFLQRKQSRLNVVQFHWQQQHYCLILMYIKSIQRPKATQTNTNPFMCRLTFNPQEIKHTRSETSLGVTAFFRSFYYIVAASQMNYLIQISSLLAALSIYMF